MASDRVDMSVGERQVNGEHGNNGVFSSENQKNSGANGDVKPGKMSSTQNEDGNAPIKMEVMPYSNGVDGLPQQTAVRAVEKPSNMDQLPAELLDILAQIPLESFVPMAHLIHRSAQTCWVDLQRLVERLSNIRLSPTKPDQDRLPNGEINDNSIQNREKKMLIWGFAKRHKDVLVKLLVLLQSGKRMEEVRKTIALNFFLHERRSAFNNATIAMGNMVRGLSAAQIPNPDLATAAEVLAIGKVASFPDLEYIPQAPLTAKQMFDVLRRLNTVLCTRLALEAEIPAEMDKWHVHDGRVTFTVPHEFELDLSVADEKPDANFGMVDVRFDFNPAPSIPDSLHDELTYRTNTEMEQHGLVGAYRFLHELTLSYKLKEFHRQASALAQGQWAGHLRVELHKRILVVQYWLKRPFNKSWIEIGIHSGKLSSDQNSDTSSELSFLGLQWTREGKRIDQHELNLDVDNLSIEDVLHQTIAQHTNHTFDSIYDRMSQIPIYEKAELSLEQSLSYSNPHGCSLDIEATKDDSVHSRVEPVSGSLALMPVSERTLRVQHELSRSKSIVDDFTNRVLGLRCALAEDRLLRSITHSGWHSLAGVRFSTMEVRSLFGPRAICATFFNRTNWTSSWMLAASFGADGDLWHLVRRADGDSLYTVQTLDVPALHTETMLSKAYFDKLAVTTATRIALQSNAQSLRDWNIRSVLPPPVSFTNPQVTPKLVIELGAHMKFSSLKSIATLRAQSSGSSSDAFILVLSVQFSAPKEVLRQLASTDLGDSVKVEADTQRLTISLASQVGESVVANMINQLRQVDNIVSCAALVYRSNTWELESCSINNLRLIYNKDTSTNLGLNISFGDGKDQIKAVLLPEANNPHQLLSPHIDQILTTGNDPLAVKLARLLSVLHMSLPLVRCLSALQGDPASIESSDTSHPVAAGSKDWLRIHVMARDTSRFGIHFFATKEGFQRDVADGETPKKMLARFEIEPRPGKDGALLSWIFRPSVEEYSTYVRPSFAAKSLSERVKKEIFGNIQSKGWLGLDTAARCKIDDPQPLLNAVHKTVLDWIKEASKPEEKKAVPESNSKQQNKTNPQTGPGKQNKAGPQTASAKGSGPGNQSSRVMTAAPQQVRNAQNNQQRQPSNAQQQRNTKGQKNQEVITLD